MTPEERADEIMGRRIPECDCSSLAWHVRTLIAMAVSEAVAEEREACAKTAEMFTVAELLKGISGEALQVCQARDRIADGIRARGKV